MSAADSFGTLCDKVVIGQVEKLRVVETGKVYEARIDTGAKTTSVNAIHSTQFLLDGKKMIRFKISQDGPEIVKKIVSFKRIKQHGRKPIKRPEVLLTLQLGSVKKLQKVTLEDRSEFDYSLLIGRNFLLGHFIVDVSLSNTQKLPKQEVYSIIE